MGNTLRAKLQQTQREVVKGMELDQLFCPDCGKDVQTVCHNESFDHELGTEWLFDFKCIECEYLLHTHRGKLPRVVEPE